MVAGTLRQETRFRDMAKKQADYRDKRNGAYDAVSSAGNRQPDQVRELITPHEAAQVGADVRPEALPGTGDLAEGLVRPRKGPYSRKSGRRTR
jgi:hypothetical protein